MLRVGVFKMDEVYDPELPNVTSTQKQGDPISSTALSVYDAAQ